MSLSPQLGINSTKNLLCAKLYLPKKAAINTISKSSLFTSFLTIYVSINDWNSEENSLTHIFFSSYISFINGIFIYSPIIHI